MRGNWPCCASLRRQPPRRAPGGKPASAARALATNNRDLPFALIYLLEPDGRSATLASTANVDPDHPAVVTTLPLDGSNPSPLAAVAQDHRPRVVSGLEMEFQAMFPSGAWQQGPDAAVLLPIMESSE